MSSYLRICVKTWCSITDKSYVCLYPNQISPEFLLSNYTFLLYECHDDVHFFCKTATQPCDDFFFFLQFSVQSLGIARGNRQCCLHDARIYCHDFVESVRTLRGNRSFPCTTVNRLCEMCTPYIYIINICYYLNPIIKGLVK